MTDLHEPDQLSELVERFSDAEQSLRSLIESNERLRAAHEQVASAERSLEASQKALADVSSGVYGLTSELKDTARDLKDTSIYLRSLDPAGIHTTLESLVATDREVEATVSNLVRKFRLSMALNTLLGILVAVSIAVTVTR